MNYVTLRSRIGDERCDAMRIKQSERARKEEKKRCKGLNKSSNRISQSKKAKYIGILQYERMRSTLTLVV